MEGGTKIASAKSGGPEKEGVLTRRGLAEGRVYYAIIWGDFFSSSLSSLINVNVIISWVPRT
jgi:hypothetical protein